MFWVMRARDISCLYLDFEEGSARSTEPRRANFPPTQELTQKAEATSPGFFR
jgi:hypothetical protein